MKRTLSLRKNSEFKSVYEHGKSIANRQLVMYIHPNGRAENRLGISVSKKVGNSVVRHRAKRMVKEIYRLSEDSYATGYDLVVVVRSAFLECNYQEMTKSLLHVSRKHGLVKRSESVEKSHPIPD